MQRKAIIRRSATGFAALTLLLSIASVRPAVAGPVTTRASVKSDVCYQIVTDRFFDGNTANNNPAVSSGMYDSTKTQWKKYWGGDFAGIQQKVSYLQGMGITTVWISPPVDNVNKLVTYGTEPNAGYHGYWARDFKTPEEHFGTWAEFDNMVTALHNAGIKVMIDFAPNHTSPSDAADPNHGEQGALYDNGTFVGNYTSDSPMYFHHNGGTNNWDDPYETQYKNMADLADFSQEHATIDSYLRSAATTWVNRGIDGIRVDAVKHMPLGWQKSWADGIYRTKDLFMFGEWYSSSTSDPLYGASVKYANTSGISLLDFPLNKAIRDTFGGTATMSSLWNTQAQIDADFKYKENLVTFIDNHDMSRFLTMNNNNARLHEAMAYILTSRGTPCINYGTEQYLHNDTGGGTDPYNRPQMPGFSTTTTAYQLINKLSTLRQNQPAIQFGSSTQRWVNNDVLIYERKFYNDVVLVAINKGTTSASISGLLTDLPAGTYSDQLTGLLSGNSITVGAGTSNRPVTTFTLAANGVGVWSYKAAEPTTPQLGSVGPTMTRAGNSVTIEGRGFGTTTGKVYFGATAATITSWGQNLIKATVPSVTAGNTAVKVQTSGGVNSNTYDVNVLTGAQVPVTFTVNNASPTNPGDYIYLSGNIPELGNWSTDKAVAIGPMLTPNYPNWFITASVPAGTAIQFKFFKLTAGGVVTWENGSNHTYTVPSSGTGSATVNWQY
ncbi:MAG TPA: alpha-amylase family glycosyl hydrolase [Symbiobacteriaceae bacterium]|nr:alpha-amylase family glycosyl hydrolase [Symbiobacteriaceae bacterium]